MRYAFVEAGPDWRTYTVHYQSIEYGSGIFRLILSVFENREDM